MLSCKAIFLAIGLKLDSSSLYSPIIRGPRSGTDAGQYFRNFWGNKSEIRHLDGDLYECVIWDSNKDITSQIVDYALSRKLNVPINTISDLWYQVSCTSLNGILRSISPSYSTLRLPARASTLHLINSLNSLRDILSGFNKHLPLNIMDVQPVSAEFRGTSVFAPIIDIRDGTRKKKSADNPWHNVHHSLRPIYAIMQIQSSGKWPKDNYTAFLHMKRLFLLRIKELLVHIGVPSRVVSTGMLDILVNGLILRLSFCHNFELKLLRRSLGLTKPYQFKSKKDLPEEKEQEQDECEPEPLIKWLSFNQRLPDIASQLVAIARSHINTFPDACRLAKRWLSAHGIPVIQCPDISSEPMWGLDCEPVCLGDADLGASGCRLTEIAVELLVVHAGGFTEAVNTSSYSAGVPGSGSENFLSASPLATFLRFLRLIYSFDWENDILLVDLNEEFKGKAGLEKAMVAVTEFKIKPRDQLPAMVIGTPLDPNGTHWTRQGLSVQGLRRLQKLAAFSHELLQAMLFAGADLSDLKAVFRPDLASMDVLFKLRPSVYKTRILEAVDLVIPKWAIKKTESGELMNSHIDPSETTMKESEPVTLNLPHPGASYWPSGYLCDPVLWVLRQIQNRLAEWDMFEYFWDRHSGKWIGLRIKDTAKCAQLCELKQFSEENLHRAGGFARHRESATNSRMGLVVDIQLALQALSAWGSEMVDSVVIQRPDAFEMGGLEIEAPETEVVVREMPEKKDEQEKEEENEQENRAAVEGSKRRNPAKRRVKKTKKAKFQA
ncbi:unnamed protein product [Rodentolepis nana]|uniref:Nucleolar protein 6 n=1 Tax=Rodentolepis nana TaxID=102285 RepID=A0A0R3T6X0_RODNA|nr:unnamed protein product [Rodentolepis nana]